MMMSNNGCRIALCMVLIVVIAASAKSPLRSAFTDPKQAIRNGWVKEVPWLPGWPKGKPLPSKLYSGFVDVSDGIPTKNSTMMNHYLLFLSESTSPLDDPLLVWWNGGPGAPSSWGLFVELGPLLLNAASFLSDDYNHSGIPSLIENPFGWSKFANVLVMETPPPVGFSYCTPPGPQGNGTACGEWNDTRVGSVNANALLVILTQHFPQLLTAKREIYFVGESYAGVYMGAVVDAMLANPIKFSHISKLIAGVAFGDACLGTEVMCGARTFGPWGHLIFFYGHGQFPNSLFEELMGNCTVAQLKSPAPLPPACAALVNKAYAMVGSYYPYNLMDDCQFNVFQSKAQTQRSNGSTGLQGPGKRMKRRGIRIATSDLLPPAESYSGYFCASNAFEIWINLTDVRTALHVPEDSNFFEADDARGLQYNLTEKSVLPTMYSLLKTVNAHGRGVSILSYNGDTDPSVDMFDSQRIWYEFASNYSLPVEEEWRAWTTTKKGILGGHIATWKDVFSRGELSFATVLGSGHMVPEYRGEAAAVLLRNWMAHSPLPSATRRDRPGDADKSQV